MSDEFTQQLEGDLAEFQKLTAASELERIQVIIHDYSLSSEQLRDKLSPGFVRLLLALLDPDSSDFSGENAPPQFSEKIAFARLFATRHLRDFLQHPVISRELEWRTEFRSSEALGHRALEQNRIIHIVKDSYFEDDNGTLSPRVRVALVGNENGSSVAATLDVEDVLLLADELIGIAHQEVERCLPIVENEMLSLSLAGLVGPLLRSMDANLHRIRELAPKLGIDLSEGQEEELKPEG